MSKKGKTGSGGRPWVEFDSPRPAGVPKGQVDKYWADPPPALSPRCEWWVRQIELGWRPPRRWSQEGYWESAELYGIYIWEWAEVICKALGNGRMGDYVKPEPEPVKEGPQTVIEWMHAELYKHLKEEIDREILWGDGT